VSERPLRPCRSADQVEAWLRRPDLEIVGAAPTPAGIQGARILTVRVPGPRPTVFRVKWRAHSTSTRRNSPRRELAAHVVQKLILTPSEYVVPPAAPHCFPLAPYRRLVDARAVATFPEAPCVYGILSYWLESVQILPEAEAARWFDFQDDGLLDDDLYRSSAVYRRSISALNVVTMLIDHADTHWKQFLIARDRVRPVIYSVDNSMSFGVRKNRSVRQDWSQLRVPAIPRTLVERLRTAADHLDELATLAELEVRNGRLEVVPAAGGPPATAGTTWVGGRLHVGLTRGELEGLRRRLTDLLRRIERGEIRISDE
jgi:hypothetical protein